MSDVPPINYHNPSGLPQPSSALAIAAMVCGIIGLLFMPLALVGLILGIIALAKRKSPADPGKGMAIAGVVTGALGTIFLPCLLISILLPSLNRAREAANRIKCASNMRQIGLAMKMYAVEEHGLLPPTLSLLPARESLAANVFVCPASNDTIAGTGDPATWQSLVIPGNGHCSYVYPYFKGLSDNGDMNTVILYEPLTDHENDGANFLYLDGHVDWLNKTAAQNVISQLNAGVNPPK